MLTMTRNICQCALYRAYQHVLSGKGNIYHLHEHRRIEDCVRLAESGCFHLSPGPAIDLNALPPRPN